MGEIRENTKQWLIFRNRERAKGRKPRKKGWDAGGFRTPLLPPPPPLLNLSVKKQANEQFARVKYTRPCNNLKGLLEAYSFTNQISLISIQ